MLQIRKNYYGQNVGGNGYETLTFLSWERHGQPEYRSKGTVNMGVSSGRGHRGTRRRTRDGVERRGYSSLVGDSQPDGYRAADRYGDQRGYGQDYDQPSEYGPVADTPAQAGMTDRAGTASQGATRRPQGAR